MATLPATKKNIEWLLDRLYETKRYVEAEGVHNPQFVLLTKGKADRQRLEEIIIHYFVEKYGWDDSFNRVQLNFSAPKCSQFQFGLGISIVLMDV